MRPGPDTGAAGGASGRRVLVVDDQAPIRTLIRRLLQTEGYQVDTAATLPQARERDPGGYDVVIVDARLGEQRGLDLIDELKSRDPAAAGRCLVITGGKLAEVPAGVASLAKPFSAPELAAAVRALTGPPAAPPPGRGQTAAAVARPAPAGPPAGQAAPAGRTVPGGQAEHAGDARPAERAGPGLRAGNGGQGLPAGGAGEGLPAGGAGNGPSAELLALVRRLRADERSEMAGYLHDGPVQELTGAILELQVLARSAGSELAPQLARVQARLTGAARSLRWLIEANEPLPWAGAELSEAVTQRVAWLFEAPVVTEVTATGPVPAGAVPFAADVAELMLHEVARDGPPPRVSVAVQARDGRLRIETTVTAGSARSPGRRSVRAGQAALDGLAAALAGTADSGSSGDSRWAAIELAVPPGPAG